MADKRISQLVERTDIANNDVVPIVASGATTTNKATISSIQEFMQENLDLGVTSVGITLGTTGTDVNVTGSPITTSGNITINIPNASATARGVVTTGTQTFAGAKTFNSDIIVNGVNVGKGEGTGADNVRVGANTLIANTTGANNTALGARSLQTNTSGVNNTAIGLNSLQSNATGVNNTSIGVGSLNFNTSGFSNVAVGKDAGKLTSSGSTLLISINSIFIGEDTRPNASNEINQIVIGHQAIGQGSNTVTIGNSDITSNKLFGRVIHADAVNADESATLGQVSTSLGGYVTLGTAQTITAQKTFTTSGSSDTMIISHGSGSGFALDVIKAGNGEAIRVQKTSGSGNAMTVIGGNFEAPTIVRTGGTSSQFLKADGSVDSSTYLTTGTALLTYVTIATPTTITGVKTFASLTLNLAAAGTSNATIFSNSSADQTSMAGVNFFGFNSNNNIYFNKGTTLNAGFLVFNNTAARTYTLPDATGTFALTSNLSAYLPLTGGTLTGALNGTSASFTGTFELNTAGTGALGFFGANNTTDKYLRIRNSSGNFELGTSSTEHYLLGIGSIPLKFYTNGTPRLTIDGSTGAATFSSSVTVQANPTGGNTPNAAAFNLTADTDNGVIVRRGGVTNPQELKFGVNQAGTYSIIQSVQANIGANALCLNPAGGSVGIGKTESINQVDIYYASGDLVNARTGQGAGTATSLFTGWHSASPTTSGTLSFNVTSNGNVTNTNNSYGAISDVKLKENIEDATPKLDDLLKIKVRNYNLIGEETKQIGVIAQELEDVFPAMVDETPDFEEVEVPQLDEEGNEVLNEEGKVLTTKERVSKGTTTKSVKYSVFVPMLIKAIQELKTEIDSLKNQIK